MTPPRHRARLPARTLSIAVGALLLLALTPVAATAAPSNDIVIGQTPAALSWIQLHDSRGIPIWNFEMSLDRGGITSPDKFFWASITDAAWGAYRSWCALALWFLDWVLTFDWVQTIASPLLAIGDAMHQVVTNLGLVPTFLTITALMAGLWLLKGRYTTAISEILIACVIAALATGIFAQPVAMIAGADGLIVTANQTGQQLAAALATGDTAGRSPEQLRQAQTGLLVDTFIRQPTQMINFGRVIDGTSCEGAYNDVVQGGPYGTTSDIRDRMGDCDPALGDYAANPSSAMAIGSVVFMPASFVILFMALLLAGSVIAAAVWAMFQSLKAVVTLVTGLLPGGGRGSLMLTAAEVVVALVVIVFTSVFLSVFLLVIQAMFVASSGESVARTFVIVDVLIVIGLVVYSRQRKQLKATTQRMAQWMARRPGGAPATRLPDRPQPTHRMATVASSAVRTATGFAQLRAQRAMIDRPAMVAGPTFIDNRQQAAVFVAGQSSAGAPTSATSSWSTGSPARPGTPQLLLPGPSSPELPPGGGGETTPPPGGGDTDPRPGSTAGGGLERVQARTKVTGTLVRAGTSAALAYATGGASTVVTGASRAVRVAQTTRRVAVTSRMAAATAKNTVTGAPSNRRGPARPVPVRAATGSPSGRPTPPQPTPDPGRNGQGSLTGKDHPRPAGKTPTGPGKHNDVPPPERRPAPAPVEAPPGAAPPRPVTRTNTENTERAARLQARLAERTQTARHPSGRT